MAVLAIIGTLAIGFGMAMDKRNSGDDGGEGCALMGLIILIAVVFLIGGFFSMLTAGL